METIGGEKTEVALIEDSEWGKSVWILHELTLETLNINLRCHADLNNCDILCV